MVAQIDPCEIHLQACADRLEGLIVDRLSRDELDEGASDCFFGFDEIDGTLQKRAESFTG